MAHPGTISDLRYLNRSRLNSEHQLQKSYYREAIRHHGVDAIYFRHDATPYEEVSAVNYDYTYGEKSTTSYWLSAPVVIYMENTGDTIILNKFGIESDTDMEAYILVDDFTENFRDKFGTTERQRFSNVALTGIITAGSGIISGEIINSDISGYTSSLVTGLTSGSVSGVYSETFIRYPKKYHSLIYKSEAYTTRRVDGTLSGLWLGTLDVSGNGTVSGYMTGTLMFTTDDPGKNNGPNFYISPQVGDFFRLDFNDDNHEEYEITRVIDRNLKSDGISPLLLNYVWQMSCVRRDPSHESIVGDSLNINATALEEIFTGKKIESNFRVETESNAVFDYTTTIVDSFNPNLSSDNTYGTYGI